MSRKVVLALSLMVFISLTEGVGLLLLLPLMQLVGLNVGQGSLGQIAGLTSYFFSSIGLTPSLVVVMIIYVAVISMNAVLGRWQTIKSFSIVYEFAAHLRKHLYKSITSTNWLFFIRMRASDFAHALTYEIERVTNGTYQFLTMISTAMVLSVYIIFTLRVYGLLTILILFVGVVLILVLKKKASSSRSSGEELSYTSKDMYSSILQHMDGMKTIKSFGMQESNIGEFSKITDQVALRYTNAIQSYADVRAFFDIGSVVFLSVIVVVMIEVMKVPTAGVLLLIFLFVRMVPMFSSIQQSYQNFINMLPAFRTIMDLEKRCEDAAEPEIEIQKDLDHKGSISEGTQGGSVLNEGIELQKVSFSYLSDNNFTINELNLMIKAGETTAIVGRSGAGKSTVADMIMGLIPPDKGEMLLDGEKLSANQMVSWRSQIGYVAQETFLFNDTIRSNLLIANPEANEKDIEDALKLAAAQDFVLNLHDGLDTIIGDRGVKLSGGERQRIALARALLRKPSLLILDEATSNLDSENERHIMEAIERLHGSMTILIIAHRLSTIRRADVIYLIDGGSLVESGTWNGLVSENGKFKAFCELQGVLY
ncbi:MAG: ABC transporter ATP-binding protein/permease [Methanobacterium paludis]|nr:ABC transporter ATP-binding protein/permease [Methanobacterium paludis]